MSSQTTEKKGSDIVTRLKLPWYFKPANRMVVALQRIGIAVGPQRVLIVPGRKSGQLRNTPIAVINIDGYDYITTGFEADWVKNARAAGWGYLKRGRKETKVSLVEMDLEQRIAMLHKYVTKLGPFKVFAEILTVPTKAEDIEREAPHCRMFRVEPMSNAGKG